jgi:hypothetical protein
MLRQPSRRCTAEWPLASQRDFQQLRIRLDLVRDQPEPVSRHLVAGAFARMEVGAAHFTGMLPHPHASAEDRFAPGFSA